MMSSGLRITSSCTEGSFGFSKLASMRDGGCSGMRLCEDEAEEGIYFGVLQIGVVLDEGAHKVKVTFDGDDEMHEEEDMAGKTCPGDIPGAVGCFLAELGRDITVAGPAAPEVSPDVEVSEPDVGVEVSDLRVREDGWGTGVVTSSIRLSLWLTLRLLVDPTRGSIGGKGDAVGMGDPKSGLCPC